MVHTVLQNTVVYLTIQKSNKPAMDNEEDTVIIAGAGILLCYLILLKQSGRKKRAFKTRLINRQRKTKGFYKTYFLPMKSNDAKQFFKYTRLSVESFNKLLLMVTPFLKKKSLPDGIGPEERLAMTLQ